MEATSFRSKEYTILAFHGTAEVNIQSICNNGYDPSRRKGQALGPGEYFAVSPNTPLGYCSGGKKILLNELLLVQHGTHHTRQGDIVVMKNPAHDLPTEDLSLNLFKYLNYFFINEIMLYIYFCGAIVQLVYQLYILTPLANSGVFPLEIPSIICMWF